MSGENLNPTERYTAVVTGAGSGIGREVATQLAALGWRVIAVARSSDTLETLAEQTPGIEPRPADLTEFPHPELIPERVDALVHAAGISPVGRVEEATPEDWRYSFALNVVAGAELARNAMPALRRTRGTIVFINSGAGFVEVPRNTVYGATKHALRALANGLRAEVENDGVRVTSIFPGPVDTPMFTGGVDRAELIRPATVARAVIDAITASDDTQLTEIRVRPRQELSW
ncbi:MAG: SDR family NAD(P)-dependent oxidoreductase [Leucobacter sp.]